MKEKILSLQNISAKDALFCGGKGANLGELIKLGLNVPDGFVITTNAYNPFSTDMPNDLEKQILSAFDELGTTYVAVRSSATAEDSLETAWAGQLSTYLFATRETLIENVKKCWNSVNLPRVNAYRKLHNIENEEISVAVVVQSMIPAEVSGIAFTVHPVTINRNEILIEAIYGLGEAIVSGLVTPDTYLVNKSDLSLISKEVNAQSKQIVGYEHGTKEIVIENSIQSIQKLSDAKIKELAKLCLKIENHYKKPQDIEWCLKDDELYILQARPITTL